MGNVAARSHRLFPGSEILVPLVPSTVVILHSMGSGLRGGSVGRGSLISPGESCRWSSKEATCSLVMRNHHTAWAAALPVRHQYKVLTIYGYLRSQCTFWKLSLLIPLCWPKSILSDATQHFLYCSRWRLLAIASCFKLHAGLLCFGTADVFQKQHVALMCDLCIPPCATGMEWGLINYDQIMLPVKSKEGFLSMGIMGARAGFCLDAIALRCLHVKTKENAKHHLVESVCVVRIPLAGDENAF